jgi:hypothetical protein
MLWIIIGVVILYLIFDHAATSRKRRLWYQMREEQYRRLTDLDR